MTARRLVIIAATLILIAVLFATPATAGNIVTVIAAAACAVALALVIRWAIGQRNRN